MHIHTTKETQRQQSMLLLVGHGLVRQFLELVIGIIHTMVDHTVLCKLVLHLKDLKQMLFGSQVIGNVGTEREFGFQVIGDDKMTGR